MNAVMEQEKDIIVRAFDKSSDNYWKTLIEIASETAIKQENVIRIVLSSGDFVQSSYREKDGLPLFTTRKAYKKNASFLDKIIGAFKNRID
ncbi:hypothetical protein [Chitinophaga cymbidii]